MESIPWYRDISSRATSHNLPARTEPAPPAAGVKEQSMGSNKLRILISAFFAFSTWAFAHDVPTGMHISTKSQPAHVAFEKGMAKMEMLHIEDGLESLRNSVKADHQFD